MISDTMPPRVYPKIKMESLLLNLLKNTMGLKNDAALARRLNVGPPVISKIRADTLRVGPILLLRMHDESGLDIRNLKASM